MSTDLMLKIGKDLEKVTHVKQSSGDIQKARDLAHEGKDHLEVFCGAEELVM